ncbi:hemicentin-1-like isoform X5 [Trematomus bernacchii]|uniref:hemicentin-1-like isoform X5 n=1 Tax=Trematomus bernacchii TaxID=40690 RepID=UPI00146CB926|nr:hemicentin-1-like isoform X5 [Trematomus bernacchii]
MVPPSLLTEMRGAAMSLTAAASGLVVFLLSVSVVQGQDEWGVAYTSTEICAVTGSTVEIRCSFTYPSPSNGSVTTVEKTFWSKQKDGESVDLTTVSEYSGHVENLCEKNICTLRIRNLRESDSAEYWFRFETNRAGGKYSGSPGVTLSVKDLSVQVERKYSNSANLKCQSSCDLPDNDYVWYKNGGNALSGTSSLQVDFNYLDSYSCALKGYEDSLSPSVCVTGRDSNTLTYTEGSICAPKGSSVDISCTYSSNECITSKFWFSPERSHQGQNPSHPEDLSKNSQDAGRVQITDTERGRSTLRISDLRDSDSAQYLFKFKTPSFEWRSDLPGTTLTVTALQVQVITATYQQSNTYAELKCHSSCSPAGVSYVWFKNGEKFTTTSISSYKGRIQLTDTISCALEGHEAFSSPIVYAPRTPSLSRPSGEIKEGSSVTLTCSSDANPAATYTWYKKNGNRNVPLLSDGPQLVFSSIQSSDSGQYFCSATNDLGSSTSANTFIDVKYAPRTPSLSRPSGEIKEGSPVTLTCSSDANPAATYTWYKKNGNRNVPPLSEGRQLFFSYIQSSDSGQYFCSATNDLGSITSETIRIDVKYAPRTPSLSRPSGEIKEGSPVTLTCSSDANPAATYTWYKKNGNRNVPLLSDGPQLVFSSIQSSDSGQYFCSATNDLGSSTSANTFIDVKYAPRTPSLSRPSGEIKEGRSVTLTCSSDANPAATYTWYKKNGNRNVPLLSDGPQLVFSSIQSSDSGQYFCSATNDLGSSTSANTFIDVKYAPRTPSLSRPSGEIKEGSPVTLTCSSDANPAAKYTWYKKNGNRNVPLLSDGPQLVFSSIQSSDSGQYFCSATNDLGSSTSANTFIDVKYAPRIPSLSTRSGEIKEGRSVTLTCSSDANPAAKYTWYKKDVNRNVPPLSEGRQLFFSYIQSSDSGQYFCSATNDLGSSTSETIRIDVKYAPRTPSLSRPSGEIKEGSPVTLTCSTDANPAATYTWYKKNGNRNVPLLSDGPQLVFSSIQSSDSGQYFCSATNDLGSSTSANTFIDVKYAPRIPSLSTRSGEIKEGRSVTLTCSSDANPAAKYTWYKKDVNRNVPPLSEGQQLAFRSIQSSDSGQYFCSATNDLGSITSETIRIDVKYAPRTPSLSRPSGEIKEGSPVTLTCSSDANPAATYTWYKKNGNRNVPLLSDGPQLVFSSIQSSDSGQYFCSATNDLGRSTSANSFIDVKYAPRIPSLSSPSGEIKEGSPVTLTCSSYANPAAKYTWDKRDQNALLSSVNEGPLLVLSSIQSSDSGQYFCRAENSLGANTSKDIFVDVKYPPKLPSVSVSPSAEIEEGSSVTLTCSSDANPAAKYTWYKEDEDSPNASGQIFTITDFRAEHSGRYSCGAQNKLGRSNSTFHLTVVKGSWKLLPLVTIPVVLLAVISLSVFLWIRKKRASRDSAEPEERPEHTEEYATVHFSNNRAEPLYSNMRAGQHLGHTEQQEVPEYAAIKFTSRAPRTRPEDPAELYSVITKAH